MTYANTALVFPCGGEQLVGLACVPQKPYETGVLVIVGGPQYRVGSHRQFVLLARRLASDGYAVFRFDCRGMGDSTGAVRTFEFMNDDIAAAIDAFIQTCPAIKNIVLWGLCDGASAALLYWEKTKDARIAGMCLLNPWVRSAETLARTQVKHYYARRFLQEDFWSKLLRGQVQVSDAMRDLIHNVRLSLKGSVKIQSRQPPFQVLMVRALAAFPGRVALVLSRRDYTAKEFLEYAHLHPEWTAALSRTCVRSHEVADADHTFSSAVWRNRVEEATRQLLRDISGPR